jgi:hypothetical protein
VFEIVFALRWFPAEGVPPPLLAGVWPIRGAGGGGGFVNHKNGINGAAYNMNQFLEDDTLDNTFENKRRGASFFTMSTNETGLTGDEWGNQGSYHLQGIETASDFGEPTASDMDSTTDRHKRGRGYRQEVSNDDTADTSYIDRDDDDAASYYRGRSDRDYDDIPQPVRQSPIVALYDAILSHPLLTCLSFPCIPCLALYVKSAERSVPPAPRRRARSKRSGKSDRKDDESTFAEYHANQVCLIFPMLTLLRVKMCISCHLTDYFLVETI